MNTTGNVLSMGSDLDQLVSDLRDEQVSDHITIGRKRKDSDEAFADHEPPDGFVAARWKLGTNAGIAPVVGNIIRMKPADEVIDNINQVIESIAKVLDECGRIRTFELRKPNPNDAYDNEFFDDPLSEVEFNGILQELRQNLKDEIEITTQ